MNHYYVYSATTTSTVAPRHTLPRRGLKTMTIAMPKQELEDGVACKLNYLGPPSGSRPFGQENLLLCMCPSPKLYIRAARAPSPDIWNPLPFYLFTIVVGLLELLFGKPFA